MSAEGSSSCDDDCGEDSRTAKSWLWFLLQQGLWDLLLGLLLLLLPIKEGAENTGIFPCRIHIGAAPCSAVKENGATGLGAANNNNNKKVAIVQEQGCFLDRLSVELNALRLLLRAVDDDNDDDWRQ